MQERRSFPRRYLMFYSRVFNAATNELVGHIVDITPTGVMLISETPLEQDIHYELKMELPEEISSKKYLVFKARCVWCKPDAIPAFFDIGFRLVDVPQLEVDLIKRLVDAFGFRDH